MSKDAALVLCERGWALYAIFCNHADVDDRSRETRQAWADYNNHRRKCNNCSKPKEEDVRSDSI